MMKTRPEKAQTQPSQQKHGAYCCLFLFVFSETDRSHCTKAKRFRMIVVYETEGLFTTRMITRLVTTFGAALNHNNHKEQASAAV